METHVTSTGRHWKLVGSVMGDGLRRILLAILFLVIYHSCSGMIQSTTMGNTTTSMACLEDSETDHLHKLELP